VNAAGLEAAKLDSGGGARYANVSICNFERKRPGRIELIK
jgi:hypothetical protein